jgi:hypothetical protein
MTLAPNSPSKSTAPHQNQHDGHDHDHHNHHHGHDHHHHDHHHAAHAAVAIPFSFFRASALQLAGLAAIASAMLWLVLIWAMQ